jgi:hypothetical protein
MAEAAMRSSVVKALKPLHAIAVENPCRPGTPDVNYIEGWIELKWLRSWPKGKDTIVRLDHYTQQQRIWAYQRRKAGGQCWFLLQCGRDWILMDGAVAAMYAGRCTKAELIAHATAYLSSGLSQQDLIDLLGQRQTAWKPTKAEIARLRETA